MSDAGFVAPPRLRPGDRTELQPGMTFHFMTGLWLETMGLEITESMLMESKESSVDKLEELRNAGFMLSVDDFGTGYSSMSYLKRFPIHALKIDRSFIQELPGNQDDAAIT